MADGPLNTGPPFLHKSRFALGIAAILLAALLAGLAIYQLRPTAATTSDVPAPKFSAARALEHIKVIAGKPRPSGAAEHSAPGHPRLACAVQHRHDGDRARRLEPV